MPVTTITSRAFNQDTSAAKKATAKGPVIITDRGRPAHVLLRFEDYSELTGDKTSLIDAISMPGGGDIEFDPPKLQLAVRPADFS